MGKNTYEFGYKFGLKPGQRAYPHMTHYIFSNSLKFGVFAKKRNERPTGKTLKNAGNDD